MATVTKQFSTDFDLWAEALLAQGDTPEGVEEIRQTIREAFVEGAIESVGRHHAAAAFQYSYDCPTKRHRAAWLIPICPKMS